MKLEYEVLHPFYKTLYDLVGQENMLKIYDEYRGMQISVPMKLYDRNLAAEKIRKEYDGTNLAELTKRYGYSQRWGSNLIKDSTFAAQNRQVHLNIIGQTRKPLL